MLIVDFPPGFHQQTKGNDMPSQQWNLTNEGTTVEVLNERKMQICVISLKGMIKKQDDTMSFAASYFENY